MRGPHQRIFWVRSLTLNGSARLTRPVRLGLALTEDATELIVLMEDELGLRFIPDGVATVFRTVVFALAGVVDGKPMRVTLCTGANNPYLGWHWKYLGANVTTMRHTHKPQGAVPPA